MLTRRKFIQHTSIAGLATFCVRRAPGEASPSERPNILWLSCEDIGMHLGCYGNPHAHTPTLDQMAREGVRYANAFTTAGVCAPNRSSIITGVYATTLGTHHMRSGGEGVDRSIKPSLPEGVRCFPAYLREAGYYCTNNAKEDYQVPTPPDTWDESSGKAHWRNCPDPETPFFAVFNYKGTHEGSIQLSKDRHAERTKRLTEAQRQNPDVITPPPFHPNTEIVRREWAEYYELITAMDYWVADMLGQLEEDGLDDNTIVIFWSDHGTGLPRCKRWIYDSGVHVPVIARIPEPWRGGERGVPGTVEEHLVSSLDFAPTVLNLCGLPIPEYMQGQPFLGPEVPEPREYVFAVRDRMDERYDTIRMVRDMRYKYIRNYQPFVPYDQFMNSAEKSPVKQELHRLAREDALPPAAQWVQKKQKPVEELYDTQKDPHEVRNLAEDPSHRDALLRLRTAHEQWMRDTRDLGLIPEPELVRLEKEYGSRYAILRGMSRGEPDFLETLRSVAVLGGRPSPDDEAALAETLDSPHPSIRYWGATGLGNLSPSKGTTVEALTKALGDGSPTVRVAAARALHHLGKGNDDTVSLLVEELRSPHEWVRLHAATALDGIGEAARPAVSALSEALEDKENKYVVRVANHAVNQLLGTSNTVR